jgi:hypothetical protein
MLGKEFLVFKYDVHSHKVVEETLWLIGYEFSVRAKRFNRHNGYDVL